MIRKLLADPATSLLSLAVIIAVGFLIISYQEKKALVSELNKLKLQVKDLANLKIGDFVPPIPMTDVSGKAVQLDYTSGKKHLLVLFSSDCLACKIQQESVWNELATQMKSRGGLVHGIFLQDVDLSKNFLLEHQYGFDIWSSDSQLVRRNYRVTKVPQIILVNSLGKVELIRYGTIVESELKDFVAQLDLVK